LPDIHKREECRVTERMDEEEARATLLEFLQERLEEYHRAGEEGPLALGREDFGQFGVVLGWNAREVSALYKRLVRGGYVRQYEDAVDVLEGREGVISHAWVEDLTDKGMRAIGVLHDPTEALAEALRAAIQDVDASEDIPEDKKPEVVGSLDRVLTVIRLVEGAAQIVSRHLTPGS